MLKILLADDHAVVRQGVKQILAEAFAQATFGDAQNALELLTLVGGEHWDIAVLDLAMPGGNGLDIAMIIGVFRAALQGVMVNIGYRALCLDPLNSERFELQVCHGSG